MSLFEKLKKAWGKNAPEPRKKVDLQSSSKQPTFKNNVSAFWSWYEENAERLYQTIEDGNSSELATEVAEATNKWLAGLSWVFGPGPNKEGHSFTLTPEGDPHRCLLSEYWLKAAPTLSGWTFYSSRQPGVGDLSSQTIKIHDEIFKPEEFWTSPELDMENECIHITAWHPLFARIDEDQQQVILFLWLDEILGERGTSDRIGQVEINDSKLKSSIPILELGGLVKKHETEQGWESHAPGSVYIGYQMDEPTSDFLRADIFTGTTTHMGLVQDYFSARGRMEDPLANSGASFVYLAFNNAYLPQGKEVETRGNIEEALIETLEAESSGMCLGGATGTENAYIDLLIFDGDKSLELIVKTLERFNLPQGSALYPFATQADTPLHVF